MTDRITLAPFTEGDWQGWAGATRAPDGSPPMIGHVDVPFSVGHPATVIADATGVEVTLWGDDDRGEDEPAFATFRVTLCDDSGDGDDDSYKLAVFIAGALPALMTPEFLLGIGFMDLTP